MVDALDDDDGAAEEQGEQGRDDHAVGIVDAGGEQVEEEAEALEHEADLTKEIGLRVEGLAAAEVGVAAEREHVRGQVDDDGDLDVGRGMAGLDVKDAGPRCAWKKVGHELDGERGAGLGVEVEGAGGDADAELAALEEHVGEGEQAGGGVARVGEGGPLEREVRGRRKRRT